MALLIATYEHQDSGLRRLTAPAADAEALAAVLRDPEIAGFEVTVLVNEPHYRVGEAISELYRDRRRDDLTLLYFTGHGLKDDDGRLYLATSNTRRDNLMFTSLPAEQIDYAMEGCASRQKVLVLDCCYSGAFPAGRAVKADAEVHALAQFQGRGRMVLTASDSTQYSFEGDELRGSAAQSVFTRHLVEGLRDGAADLDGDGDITVDELYSYVHDRVVEEMPQQRPKKQSNVEGHIVIARNGNWALPGYLRNALGSPIATDRLGALDGLLHLHRIGNPSVRAHVAAEIERLTDDDSRAVSAAAAARLRAIRSSPSAQPGDGDSAAPTIQPTAALDPPPTRSPTRTEPSRSQALDEGMVMSRRGKGSFVRQRTERVVGLRPHIEQAFDRQRVSIDFAGFSGETLAGALQEPLDKIRIGRLTPDEIALRVLLPDLSVPVGLPALASTGADDERVRARAQQIADRFNQVITDSLYELAGLQLVRSVSAQVRVYRTSPLFKLYILNGDEAFFGFYPVLEHKVLIEREPTAICDPMGKDAVLFHFSSNEGETSIGVQYVTEAQKWFNSVWNSVSRPVAP